MTPEAKEFMRAMCPILPDDQRMIVCGFPGDPFTAPPNAWKPKPWTPERMDLRMSKDWNVYMTIASFTRAHDKTWRRRGELFGSAHAIMIDDIGTKAEALDLPPSAIVETSPDNFQWWYFFDKPETNNLKFDGLIRAFIREKMLGYDPGMAGITRVGRLPGYFNGKAKYGGFHTVLTELNKNRYSIDELLEGFGIEIHGERRPAPKSKYLPEYKDRIKAFFPVYKWLQQHGMLKRSESDLSGWTEMTCPWVDDHTSGADNGAGIVDPSLENDYYGGFKCHHGHCIEKRWRDLTEWVNEQSAGELEDINKEATDYVVGQ